MFLTRFLPVPVAVAVLLALGLPVITASADDRPGVSQNSKSEVAKSSEPRETDSRSSRQNTTASRDDQHRPRVTVLDLRNHDADQKAPRNSEMRRLPCVGTSKYLPFGIWYGYTSSSYDVQRIEAYENVLRLERREQARKFNKQDMAARKSRLLAQHEQAVRAGQRRMKEGQYQQALAAFSLAANLNQGDAACRLYLAQTQLALGHYLAAGEAVRRGLQLQPQLVYMDLHLERYYQDTDELDRYTDKLSSWLQTHPAEPEVYFLLGYMEFQRGNSDKAWNAFNRIQEVWPKDNLTRDYLELTEPARVEESVDPGRIQGENRD